MAARQPPECFARTNARVRERARADALPLLFSVLAPLLSLSTFLVLLPPPLNRAMARPVLAHAQPFIVPARAPRRALPRPPAALPSARAATLTAAEASLLAAIDGVAGRGAGGLSDQAAAAVAAAVATLEADGGIPAPASAQDVEGKWLLVFTTRPGTSSPIQRAFTARDSFTVHQEIELAKGDGTPQRVTNVVTLGSAGVLRVEAEASTTVAPLPGFTPRRGAGLPLFGKSQTGPPADPTRRIDFAFDRAYFKFKALPVTVPYLVPFKFLQSTGLGDEVKGWIDVTYLAPKGEGRVRLSRGNKGTLFVLVRDD